MKLNRCQFFERRVLYQFYLETGAKDPPPPLLKGPPNSIGAGTYNLGTCSYYEPASM